MNYFIYSKREDFYVALSKALHRKGLLPDYVSHYEFMKVRLLMDKMLQDGTNDASLEKAYRFFPNFLGDAERTRSFELDFGRKNILSNLPNMEYKDAACSPENIFGIENILFGGVLKPLEGIRKNLYFRDDKPFDEVEKEWYRIGAAVLGPFLTLFCDWVVDVAVKEGIGKIFPIMREGTIYTKLCNEIIARRELNISVKPIWVSTVSCFLARFDKCDDECLGAAFYEGGGRKKTIGEAFSLLEIKDHVDEFTDMTADSITNDEIYKKISQAIMDGDLRATIENNISKRKRALGEYLVHNEVSGKFITVDGGSLGNVPWAICNALNYAKVPNEGVHLFTKGLEKVASFWIRGCRIQSYYGNMMELWTDSHLRHLFARSPIYEALILDTEDGHAVSYHSERDDNATVVCEKSKISQKQRHLVSVLWEGVLDFYRLYADIKAKGDVLCDAEIDNSEAVKALNRLICFPTTKEASAFLMVEYEQGFGKRDTMPLIENLHIQEAEKSPEEFAQKYFSMPTNHKWPEAALSIAAPNYVLMRMKSSKCAKNVLHIIGKMNFNREQNAVIFGAATLGKALLQPLLDFGINVCCYIDRERGSSGAFVKDVPIITLDRLAEYDFDACIIASSNHAEEIRREITQFAKANKMEFSIYEITEINSADSRWTWVDRFVR